MDLNEIQKFIGWLMEKTGANSDIEEDKINIGGRGLSIEYLFDQYNNTNPLKISINHQMSSVNILSFHPSSQDGSKSSVQFIKRIRNTPFYYSYFVNQTCSLKMIDFYQWTPVIVLYRIFVLQKYQPDSKLFINSLSDVTIRSSGENIETGKLFLKISQPFDISKDKKCITIKTGKETDQQIIIMAISADPIHQDLSFPAAVNLLYRLEDNCREKHISKNFIVNYKAAEQELDDLWTRQKYIQPDQTIDPVILCDPDTYARKVTWIVEMCCYLGWKESLLSILNAIKKNINKNNINWRSVYTARYLEDILHIDKKERFTNQYIKKSNVNSDNLFHKLCSAYNDNTDTNNEDEIIYAAYFKQSIKTGLLINYLQEWWDLISLPLMNKRLLEEITENEEKIFLIAILGFMHQLPWAVLLIQYMKKENVNSFFRLIVFMFSRITVRKLAGTREDIYSGCMWDNNVKRLCRKDNDFSYAYTRFSKNIYFTVKANNKKILRINHQLHCIYDNQKHQFILLPAVFNMDHSVYREIQLKVDDYTLHLPLVFRKGEILLSDVRFRWIYKKRRFQFTMMNKTVGKKVCIDNQTISFDKSIKQTHYITIAPRDPEIEISVLNNFGRRRHYSNCTGLREIQIYGWACDRFGILVQHFNYIFARKQYINTIVPSGAINNRVFIPPDVKEIDFIIKKAKKLIPVQYYNSLFIEKITHFSPDMRENELVVLIDDDLQKNVPVIQKFFAELFYFQPDYHIRTADMLAIQSSLLLYLSNSTNKVEIISDPSISTQPFCRIGIKKGTGGLFDFYIFLKDQVSV